MFEWKITCQLTMKDNKINVGYRIDMIVENSDHRK